MKNIFKNKIFIEYLSYIVIWISYSYFIKYFLWLDKENKIILNEDLKWSIFIVLISFLLYNLLFNLKYWGKNIIYLLTTIIVSDYIIFDSFFIIYYTEKIINLLSNVRVILSIILALITIFTIYWIYKLCNSKEEKKWFLFSDKPIENEKDDKLWFNEKAKDFVNSIYNNWSTDWFVFWLVAPWWAGKSSFLKLVELEIEKDKKYKWEIKIFKFNPWYFDSESILVEKFINWFKDFLIETTDLYLPELKNDFDLLYKILDKKTESFLWFNFWFHKNKNLQNIIKDIDKSLEKIDKKIVILIDDLDRIPSEKLKTIFKIIDICKWFYNTNFVLCYDTENLNNIDENLKETTNKNEKEELSIINEKIDNKNLIKYIEKIVTVQYNIYPDFEKLKKYFYDIFTQEELWFSEESKDWIKQWINNLFELENYRVWWSHISEIRSIKRLYNHLIITKTNRSNLENNSLINFKNLFDLDAGWLKFDTYVKLEILSLSYNDLYKDIYNEIILEDNERWERKWNNKNKYNLIYNYISSENYYLSNENYLSYLKELSHEKSKIIQNIFQKIKETEGYKWEKNIDVRDIRLNNNLSEYINIIEKEIITEYERFLINKMSDFYNSKKELNIIISEINKNYNENWIEKFIDKIRNNIHSWVNKKEKATVLVNYIIDYFYNYSFSLIDDIYIKIEDILDKSVEMSYDNEEIKYKYIKDLIYWEWDFKDNWILKRLFNNNWWIKWLYIALWFFHWLENSSIYLQNYQKWMLWDNYNENKKSKWEKIWKEVFKFFKEKYIEKNKNIFEEIEIERNKEEKFRNVFIIYQLSVEIWYFDNDYNNNLNNWEKQNNWIKKELSKYYFNSCFNWENIKYFVDYSILTIMNKFRVSSFINENNFKDLITNVTIDKIDIFDINLLGEFIKKEFSNIEKYIIKNSSEVCYKYEYTSSSEWNVTIYKTYLDFNEMFEKIYIELKKED